MAVWDEIKDILASIDSKLGDNSAKRAGILGDVLPKKKEKSEDAKLQSLENTIQKAFSKIPVLNQLLPVIQGFRDTLRDLLALRGLFGGVKDIADVGIKIHKVSDVIRAGRTGQIIGGTSGYTMWNSNTMSYGDKIVPLSKFGKWKEKWGGLAKKGIKDFGIEIKKGWLKGQADFLADQLGLGGQEGRAGLGGIAMGSFFGKKGAGAAGAAGAFPKAVKSLLAPIMSSIGAMAATLAGVVAAVVAAVVVATVAVIGFAKHLVFAKRGLAKLNAEYAVAFAMFDIRTMFRDMRSAAKTSAVSQKFLTVWGDFLDKIQPVLDELFIIFVKLGIGTLKVVNKLIDISPDWEDVVDSVASGAGYEIAQWLGVPTPTEIGGAALNWWQGGENESLLARDAHDGKIMSLMEKANRAMDLIIKAHEEDLDAAVPVSAAAFMAGVAGVGYESDTVRDMNLRPDLDVIWKRHAELK